jgi:predicted enzyme related to lactoylglutathione lyase
VESVKGFRPVALNVGVRGIEEAIEFYEGVFGANLEVSAADGPPTHARWQFGEGASFFLFNLRRRGGEDPHRDHISAFGFNVDDLEATHRRAIAAGAKEHGHW